MPARWLSRACRATTTSALDSAKKASRAWELWAVSRRMSRVGSRPALATRPAERPPPDHRGSHGGDGDPEHGHRLRGVPQDERDADDQAWDPQGQVDRRQRGPPPLALQDPGLGPHQRQRYRGERHQHRGKHAVESEHALEQRGEHQEQDAERAGGEPAHAEHLVLDLHPVLRLGRDPACSGRLEPERQHAGDEQGGHQGRDGAVLVRAEDPGGEDGEAVGADVGQADGHRHRAAAAGEVPQPFPRRHGWQRIREHALDSGG